MSHLPTGTDFIHSMFYASDVIKNKKCVGDTDITNKYGKDSFVWQNLDQFRVYPCPTGLSYSCEHGSCRIATQAMCNSVSQLPFNKYDGSNLNQPSCNPSATGTNTECQNLEYNAICGSSGKCIPKYPYLEWSLSYTGPSGTSGRCILGNSSLKKWCEYPQTRRTESTPGVTNVPAFQYDDNYSKCQITKSYCDWMEVSFSPTGPLGPSCYTTGIQSFFEDFFVGKTIFRGIKSMFEGFNNLGYQLEKIGDRRYASDYGLIKKDFGGKGINLYSIIWNDKIIDKYPQLGGGMVGFFSDEIEKVYPELVRKKNGDKYIIINRTQVQLNPSLKRIYLIVGSGKWVLESLMKAVKEDLK